MDQQQASLLWNDILKKIGGDYAEFSRIPYELPN